MSTIIAFDSIATPHVRSMAGKQRLEPWIGSALQASGREQRLFALKEAYASLGLDADWNMKLHQSMQRRARDIMERAFTREYGSPLGSHGDDWAELFFAAASAFESQSHSVLINLASRHWMAASKLQQKQRRIRKILALMEARRI